MAILSTVARRVRDVGKTFHNRPDSEHEQAFIRIVIVTIVLVYLASSAHADGQISPSEWHTLLIVGLFNVFSLGLLLRIAEHPTASPQRRILGMASDIGATCYVMQCGGEPYSPFYVILLWVTLGHGIRYGRKYLFGSAALSVASFSLVIFFNDYWRSQRTLALGLLLGIIVLPAYVSSLLRKLTNAISHAEEANRAKNQFLANMSHEMRTPLTGILGMVDLLRGTPLTAEQDDFADTIHTSAKTLLFLIEDVLDISKIEAGKLKNEIVDFDLHDLVKSTSAMMRQQAKEKGLVLSVVIPSRIPFQLRGDPSLIRQILLNLLSNAIKFTEEGEVGLHVDAVEQTTTSVILRIEVTDTGIGIPADAQERIFHRFTQADESITRRFGGSGLGTTIAKQLVELMGGTIGLQSEPGKGSTFWFTLPLETRAPEASQAAGTGALSGSRILVISSHPQSSEILENHLASWGVKVVQVDEAAQGFSPLIAAANEGKPYQIAVIVQRNLDMDPVELANALRSVHLLRNLQLILVTREEDEPDPAVLTKQGFSSSVGPSLDKTLVFNALHFVRPTDAEHSEVPTLASRYLQKKGEHRGVRILIAEDNLTNQKVIAKILERAGHETHLVANGEEALEALEHRSFDLVLLDLNMPVMGGLEVAKVLRFTRQGASAPPLVALTADATHESRHACEEAGFDGYVTKPVETKELLKTIDALVPGEKREPSAAAPASRGVPRHQDATEKGRDERAVDPTVVAELTALGETGDFLEKIIKTFLDGAAQKIAAIEKAMRSRDYGGVMDNAHALKGSAGQIGAMELMAYCDLLHRAGPTNLSRDGNENVRILKEKFEKVRAELQKYLRATGAPEGPGDQAKPQNDQSGVFFFPRSSRNR